MEGLNATNGTNCWDACKLSIHKIPPPQFTQPRTVYLSFRTEAFGYISCHNAQASSHISKHYKLTEKKKAELEGTFVQGHSEKNAKQMNTFGFPFHLKMKLLILYKARDLYCIVNK